MFQERNLQMENDRTEQLEDETSQSHPHVYISVSSFA